MAYYFKCEKRGKEERFALRDDNGEYHDYCNEGKSKSMRL